MKTGFAHFDGSHRENFCASVLLLAMDVDDSVRDLVATAVCNELGIGDATRLIGFGREARLAETDDDNYARTDLWLLFDSPTGSFYVFVEVKTHDNWDARSVAEQVKDQASRTGTRTPQQVRGAVLLAPDRLCRRVAAIDPKVPTIAWPYLRERLRSLASRSPLTKLAIHHLEENVDRPASLDRTITLSDFEQATTTIACLRQFIIDCIRDIGGHVHGEPTYFTPADGAPRRGSGWAWHGLSVPFSIDGQKGRVGIYKYAETPPGEENAMATLWLEAYFGDADLPVAFVVFAPATLSAKELDAAREALKAEWTKNEPASKDAQPPDTSG